MNNKLHHMRFFLCTLGVELLLKNGYVLVGYHGEERIRIHGLFHAST